MRETWSREKQVEVVLFSLINILYVPTNEQHF